MSQETFDGQEIAGYVAVIPPMKLEAPESYQRGTYLTLQVEVRVRSVRYEEVSTGKSKGDLLKVHMLATEDVKILGVMTPQERLALYEAQNGDFIDGEVVEETAQIEAAEVPEEAPEEVVNEVLGGATDEAQADTWEYPEPEGVKEEVTAGF